MLRVENIHVSYGQFEALSGLSFEINEGEIVALLGSNGAGKSTLINTISGLNHVTEGDIIYNGTSIKDIPPHDRVPMGIIQSPEGRKLFPYLTVYENLLVGSCSKVARAKRAESLEMCYELFPKLKERSKQLAGSMSGGEQQMCAIARALMGAPKILMLDEPSLGLAPVIVKEIFDVLVKINKMGMTVLLVEQNVMSSLKIATRGYVIESGRNVLEGNAADLLGNEEVKRTYLGL